MSLDVYLYLKDHQRESVGTGIFIRENGQNREITRAEWDERYPDREPFILQVDDDEAVFHRNITHNLGQMASKASIYQAVWHPDENEITHAVQLIGPLEMGLDLLKGNPSWFRQFNPENGWGNYEALVDFAQAYLDACREYPDAEVSVSR